MAQPDTSTASTRDRLVASAAALLLRNGYSATGLKAITAAGRAPVGSLYHHFPGGKEELAAEAIRVAGAGYQLLVDAVVDDAPDLATGIARSFPAAAAALEASGYADACPIATVALEVANTNEVLRRATAEVFEGWTDALARRLTAAGLASDEARTLAYAYLAALEGGFVLSRATRSTEPLLAAGRVTAEHVAAALASADGP